MCYASVNKIEHEDDNKVWSFMTILSWDECFEEGFFKSSSREF